MENLDSDDFLKSQESVEKYAQLLVDDLEKDLKNFNSWWNFFSFCYTHNFLKCLEIWKNIEKIFDSKIINNLTEKQIRMVSDAFIFHEINLKYVKLENTIEKFMKTGRFTSFPFDKESAIENLIHGSHLLDLILEKRKLSGKSTKSIERWYFPIINKKTREQRYFHSRVVTNVKKLLDNRKLDEYVPEIEPEIFDRLKNNHFYYKPE